MKIMLGGVCAAIVAIGLSSQAYASSTDVVLNLEGNPTCSSLGDNDAIIEARDNNPQVGVTNTAVGPDGQEVTYEIRFDPDEGVQEVESWRVTNAPFFDNINYTILKARGKAGAKVYHFGAAGVPEDFDEDSNGEITAVSFCYGLTGDAKPPSKDMVNLGPCSGLTNLDGSTIACPVDNSGNPDAGQQRMLISLDITNTRTANDFNAQFCTCNLLDPNNDENTLPECDPELSQDETRGGLKACTEEDRFNARVPIVIQGVENPHSYICFTSGGRRVCYGSF